MLTILVVSARDFGDEGFPDHPSLELLHARDAEEALEKLGRNRRIDAVVLAGWDAEGAAEIVAAIRDDNPAPPPLFAAGGGLAGLRPLPRDPAAALEALELELTAES